MLRVVLTAVVDIGRGVDVGDPLLTEMLTKARLEFDKEKRRSQVKEIQRYWGKRQYTNRAPGGANEGLTTP